jgi:hypothetical protein
MTARFPNSGGGGGGAFHWQQSTASALWTVTHNLGFFPDVQAFDTDDRQVEGDVSHISDDQLTIAFTAAIAGDAYCN